MAKTTKTAAATKTTTKPPVKKTTATAKTKAAKPEKTIEKTPAKAKKITTKATADTKKITSSKATKPVAEKKVAAKKIVAKKVTTTPKSTPKAKVKKISRVDIVAQAMLDKKAQHVVSLDLSELGTAICDHFVVCHADSTTNVLAIADNVEKVMHEQANEWPFRVQGKENAFWIILDYIDIVVHIFQTEYRQFYRLEELWADAVRKEYTDEPSPKKAKK